AEEKQPDRAGVRQSQICAAGQDPAQPVPAPAGIRSHGPAGAGRLHPAVRHFAASDGPADARGAGAGGGRAAAPGGQAGRTPGGTLYFRHRGRNRVRHAGPGGEFAAPGPGLHRGGRGPGPADAALRPEPGAGAMKVGKSQSAVANKLRLLKHPPQVLEALRKGGFSERHARALLRLPVELRLEALEVMGAKAMTVAQAEQYIESLLKPTAQPQSKPKYIFRDVRVFLNSLDRDLDLIRSAGIPCDLGREET